MGLHHTYCSVRLIIIGLLLGVCANAAGNSTQPRCRLEQIWTSADALYTLAVAVNHDGSVVPLGNCELLIGGTSQGARAAGVPMSPAPELRIVLAVQASAAYEHAAEELKGALQVFLRQLPARSRVHLITFSDGDQVHALPGFRAPAALQAAIDAMAMEGETHPALAKALRAGMNAFDAESGPEQPTAAFRPRQMIVLISDGMNTRLDRNLFRGMGKELSRRGVPLFPIAFSAEDIRSPLRNLGELARRSSGTFRWARDKSALAGQLASLANEIRRVEALKFSLPARPSQTATELALSLRCDTAPVSNAVMVSASVLGSQSRAPFLATAAFVAGLLAAAGWALRRKLQHGREATESSAPTRDHSSGQRTYHLIFIAGPLAGRRVALRGPLILGHEPTAPGFLAIPDSSLAAQHCSLKPDGQTVLLSIPDTKRQVFRSGAPVSGQIHLSDGEIIKIGAETEFVLRADPAGST